MVTDSLLGLNSVKQKCKIEKQEFRAKIYCTAERNSAPALWRRLKLEVHRAVRKLEWENEHPGKPSLTVGGSHREIVVVVVVVVIVVDYYTIDRRAECPMAATVGFKYQRRESQQRTWDPGGIAKCVSISCVEARRPAATRPIYHHSLQLREPDLAGQTKG